MTIGKPVTGDELEAIIKAQNVRIEPGDALLVYSGRESFVKEAEQLRRRADRQQFARTLAQACAEERRYEFMLVALPLKIVRGTGSPANPIATFEDRQVHRWRAE